MQLKVGSYRTKTLWNIHGEKQENNVQKHKRCKSLQPIKYSLGIYEITMWACNLKVLVGQSENAKIKNKKQKSLFSAEHENVDEETQNTVNFYY